MDTVIPFSDSICCFQLSNERPTCRLLLKEMFTDILGTLPQLGYKRPISFTLIYILSFPFSCFSQCSFFCRSSGPSSFLLPRRFPLWPLNPCLPTVYEPAPRRAELSRARSPVYSFPVAPAADKEKKKPFTFCVVRYASFDAVPFRVPTCPAVARTPMTRVGSPVNLLANVYFCVSCRSTVGAHNCVKLGLHAMRGSITGHLYRRNCSST